MRRLLPILLASLPALALAQATVRVEVREPGGNSHDGRVTLTSEEGRVSSCTTRGGSCVLSAVGGGRYVLRFESNVGSEPPEPRTVIIPPSGSVTLRVSAF